jgi:hypothetical protein
MFLFFPCFHPLYALLTTDVSRFCETFDGTEHTTRIYREIEQTTSKANFRYYGILKSIFELAKAHYLILI